MKKNIIYDFAFMLISFIFFNIFVTSFLWIIKISISEWNFIIAFLLSLGCWSYIYYRHRYSKKEIAIVSLLLLLFIGGSFYVSGKILDNSCDGNLYHKIAIGQMSKGWNPIYQSIEDFNEESSVQVSDAAGIWNDHYGKATWTYAANVYNITGNIECGKSITLLLIISTFAFVLAILNFKSKYLNYILAFLIALNPVILCQFGTFYNDGILGNFLIVMLISLFIMSKKSNSIEKSQNFILYFMTLCILINIKFTGFAYAGIYSFVFYLYFLINKKQRLENFKWLTITAVLSLFVGIGIIGVSTYPKNFLDHGNPFYPLYGSDAVDIMDTNTPTGLIEMNRIKRFLVSNLSETTNESNTGNKSYKLKIPFTFRSREITQFSMPDTRIAGYGVLFGGILITSCLGIVYFLFKKRKFDEKTIIAFLPLFATLFIILILKESWWARYLPQLYLIPFIVLFLLNGMNGDLPKNISKFIVLALLINFYIIFNSVYESIGYGMLQGSKEIDEVQRVLKDEQTIKVSSKELPGALFNVIDKFSNVEIVEDICEKDDILYLMNGKVCVDLENKEE